MAYMKYDFIEVQGTGFTLEKAGTRRYYFCALGVKKVRHEI
jgi:hypothetical protein